jgi:hypothetical protein
VGNGGLTLAEKWVMFMESQVKGQIPRYQLTVAELWPKTLLEEACKKGSTVNYITDSIWRPILLDALQNALQSRGGDIKALNLSILEFDKQLAKIYEKKYGVEGVTSVLQHILNTPPPSIPTSEGNTAYLVSSNVDYRPIGWGQPIGVKRISGKPVGWG